MIDIHHYSKRLERAKRRLAGYEDGELLLKFISHLEALGLSAGRIAKYAVHLCTIFKNVEFDPAEAKRADVESVIAWINRQPYRAWTKHDLKMTVRKIVQYAKQGSCDRNMPIPPEASWFPMKANENDSRVKPESLLTPEELKAMISAAENDRDRALLNILYEAALRPGELLTMRVGCVEFKDGYCLISVNGKTGVKRIPLVVSSKPLLEWLEKHPRKKDLDAPLWASIGNNSKGNGMSYPYLRKILRKLAKKAGVKKEVWPYLFRHSRLTSLAKVFTESRLELYAGWVQGSKMTRRYVHFSARDLEDAVLELHGLRKSGRSDGVLRLVECPRCGRKNQPDSVRCSFCGYILDKSLAMKIEEKRTKRDTEIIERLQRLEKAVSSLLNAREQSSSRP